MAGHTNGPWERRRNWIEQCDPGVKRIARVEFPCATKEKAANPTEEAEAFANASLISASPDMLAVLADLMEFWDHGTAVHAGAEIVAEARSAIAKAKGDTP